MTKLKYGEYRQRYPWDSNERVKVLCNSFNRVTFIDTLGNIRTKERYWFGYQYGFPCKDMSVRRILNRTKQPEYKEPTIRQANLLNMRHAISAVVGTIAPYIVGVVVIVSVVAGITLALRPLMS